MTHRITVYNKAVKIFERLLGVRESSYLTQSKFASLAKLPGMTHKDLLPTHYNFIYLQTTSKLGGKIMDLATFFDAITVLASRLNPTSTDHFNAWLSIIEHLYPLIVTSK